MRLLREFRGSIWLLLVMACAPGAAVGQEGDLGGAAGQPLSLEEALRIAGGESEQVVIARAGIEQAESDVLRARSARLPQLNASASYSRTLASQFQDIGGGGAPVTSPPHCQVPFEPDPDLSAEERLRAIEMELTCPPSSGFGGIDFDEIGFGSENTYNVGLSFSLPLFTGGRLSAQSRIAEAGREVAEIGLTSAEAQIRVDVTQAYFDAQLADRLVQIAQATYEQLAEVLRLTELGAQAGTQAEFDVLRARVALQNQQPILIQREAQRDIAYDRLRLLLNMPMTTELALTTTLESVIPADVDADAEIARAPVRQAAEAVVVQENQVDVARAQRLPNVSLTSQYGQVAFSGIVPALGDFRDNWSVGAALQVPIFNGGRISAEVRSAQASLSQARAQYQQAQELAALDTRSALAQLDAARATWAASQGTVEQAERAYSIAELRYREGISSQIELTDSRLLLEQALANRATAARDLRVAEVRVELLPFLPVSGASGIAPAGSAGMPGGAGPTRAPEPQPSTQPQQSTAPVPAAAGQLPGGGGF